MYVLGNEVTAGKEIKDEGQQEQRKGGKAEETKYERLGSEGASKSLKHCLHPTTTDSITLLDFLDKMVLYTIGEVVSV